jgi:hypothetical protein
MLFTLFLRFILNYYISIATQVKLLTCQYHSVHLQVCSPSLSLSLYILYSGMESGVQHKLTYLNFSPYTFTMSRLFFHLEHFTDGRTPWTSDKLVAGPLHKHRTTQTLNKHIHIPNIDALCGIRTHDLGFRYKQRQIFL